MTTENQAGNPKSNLAFELIVKKDEFIHTESPTKIAKNFDRREIAKILLENKAAALEDMKRLEISKQVTDKRGRNAGGSFSADEFLLSTTSAAKKSRCCCLKFTKGMSSTEADRKAARTKYLWKRL